MSGSVAKPVRTDDAALVAAFRQGSEPAFNRLVLRYQDMITGLCVRLLGNREDGEEAAQETFVKAYKGMARFRSEAVFSTWLYRIALNTCRNVHKSWWQRLRRRAVRLDRPVETETGAEPRELGDTRMLPEKELHRKRLATAINRALKTLPANRRELVVLRDVQGMSYEEIERITGIAPGTVKSRLARARAALQRELKDIHYE